MQWVDGDLISSELLAAKLPVKPDQTLPKPACLDTAPHLPITALHRASMENQVIWLKQLSYLLGEGGRRVSVIQFNSKRREQEGEREGREEQLFLPKNYTNLSPNNFINNC